MKEIPILMSGDMIRAILAGRKSQTRRIIKPQPDENHHWRIFKDYTMAVHLLDTTNGLVAKFADCANGNIEENICVKCRYGQPGDLLYVKETFQVTSWLHSSDENYGYIYRESENGKDWEENSEDFKWKSPLFMPQSAARIWLRNTGVRVERLQDISERDAISEGIEVHVPVPCDGPTVYKNYQPGFEQKWEGDIISKNARWFLHPKDSFRTLIQSIHGNHIWNDNPFVWVVNFAVLSTTGRNTI